jgi:TrpR-related protein YerC/YecD
MNKWCQKEIAEVIEALSECKAPEDICEIFDAILTPREINDMARRYKIKKMLEDGQSYSEIKMTLGVSSDVISRVSTKIGYGFRRTESSTTKIESVPGYKDPLTRKKGIYYKGVPSPGTMIRNLRNK